jgi:hypothetical protein
VAIARRVYGAVLAASCGALAGCLLDLPAACGDGNLDPSEQCDPAAPGAANCDPVSCQLVVPDNCGDGKLDPGEECDTADFGNKSCPSGKGYLSCTADCKLDQVTCFSCGNGRVDSGEECDSTASGIGGFGTVMPCSALKEFPIKPYTSGDANICHPDTCKWVRTTCGYCGDKEADDEELLDINYPTSLSKREICDGEASRLDDLHAYCDDNCPILGLSCEPSCADDCKQFVPPADDLRCCVPEDAPCPDPGDPAPCCVTYGLKDPFDAAVACEDRKFGQFLQSVCK